MARTVYAKDTYRLDVVPGSAGLFLWVLFKDGCDIARAKDLFASEDEAAADGISDLTHRLLADLEARVDA